MFNPKTHNGIITIKSLKSGDHRTIRIRTQKPDAKFAPGERIIELLSGPDNTCDYRGFGFVKSDGSVILWKKNRTGFFEWLKRFVESGCEHKDVETMAEGRCIRCNRTLTDPQSIESGIGPKCREMELV